MRKTCLSALYGAALIASGFGFASPAPAAERGDIFIAILSGHEEVPPRPSRGRGVAFFRLSQDGTQLEYKLIVANIRNVTASHIHVAAPGVNGPVVAFLAGPFEPGGGRFSGVLATGTITAADLVGPLKDHPFSDLIAAMEAGDTYVNVHTDDGVPPPNTGVGDFPGGEIRGQVRDLDHLD